jgi:hypothetical protein
MIRSIPVKHAKNRLFSISLILVLIMSTIPSLGSDPARAMSAPSLRAPAEGAITTVLQPPTLGYPRAFLECGIWGNPIQNPGQP